MTKSKYMISVIIPCYNAEETIIRTLESVDKQTFKDFEVIIIDDGSVDGTKEKVSNYIIEKDNYIFIEQENKGVSSARNHGLINARGKYIAFLDADDIYHPIFLESLFKEIEKGNNDLVCSQYRFVNLDDISIDECSGIFKTEKITNREVLERYMKKRKYRFSFWNILYKREIVVSADINFDEKLKYGEDSLFLGKYLAHANNGAIFIYRELYGYTLNEKSAMHKKVSWQNTDNIEAMKLIVNYWNANGLDTNFADYMISRAIWGIAKDFAQDEYLYDMLKDKYDVYGAMKVLEKYCDELLVKLSSVIYLVNDRLFVITVKMVYRIGN